METRTHARVPTRSARRGEETAIETGRRRRRAGHHMSATGGGGGRVGPTRQRAVAGGWARGGEETWGPTHRPLEKRSAERPWIGLVCQPLDEKPAARIMRGYNKESLLRN